MKTFIYAAVIFGSFFINDTQAQSIRKASLQASGLTCSMCSNSINKALKTIDYIESVRSNISTSTFEITFKPGAKVNFDDLKFKVEDAGFSVANLTAQVEFNNTSINNDEHINIDGMSFHFLNVKGQVLTGNKTIRILDKGFVTSKEYKKNEKFTSKECYKTGKTAACCSKDGIAAGARIYHVTI